MIAFSLNIIQKNHLELKNQFEISYFLIKLFELYWWQMSNGEEVLACCITYFPYNTDI